MEDFGFPLTTKEMTCDNFTQMEKKNTRVGTLIVATIYLQLIQTDTHCQRCGSRRISLAAPVVLIVRMERSAA